IISTKTLSSELTSRVCRDRPAAVLVASVPPGGLAQTLYLLKRLRRHCPDLRILVGRWGQEAVPPRARERLAMAGALHLATKLRESRDQLIPLVQVASLAPLEHQQEDSLVRAR